jgi:hypothetical protein
MYFQANLLGIPAVIDTAKNRYAALLQQRLDARESVWNRIEAAKMLHSVV